MLEASFYIVRPEITLSLMACLILLFDLYTAKRFPRVSYLLSLLALIAAIIFTFALVGHSKEILFFNSFILDDLATLMKLFVLVIAFFVFIYARKYVVEHKYFQGEYYVLSLFSIIGMMILISAASLLTLY